MKLAADPKFRVSTDAVSSQSRSLKFGNLSGHLSFTVSLMSFKGLLNIGGPKLGIMIIMGKVITACTTFPLIGGLFVEASPRIRIVQYSYVASLLVFVSISM